MVGFTALTALSVSTRGIRRTRCQANTNQINSADLNLHRPRLVRDCNRGREPAGTVYSERQL